MVGGVRAVREVSDVGIGGRRSDIDELDESGSAHLIEWLAMYCGALVERIGAVVDLSVENSSGMRSVTLRFLSALAAEDSRQLEGELLWPR